ncbi:MAG: polysaccharide biosynthesis C-terminal domain-containing protein [Bacteroidota bacterium]|nr:polysaccharide biosynthesis C-terminal domain-containing protein [Bacteroidota bacterium]
MSLLRKLAGETVVYGLGSILSRVLNYILFTWYLTRVFNTELDQFGIYKELYFFVALFLIVLSFRMETTYFRYAKENRPAVTLMSLVFLTFFSGLFLAVVWIFKNQIATLLDYPNMATHLVMLGWVLLFDVVSAVPFASLRQQNRPWMFLGLKMGSILINLLFVLFFIEMLPGLSVQGGFWENIYRPDDKLFYVFLSNLIASGLTLVLLLPLMRGQELKWDISFLKRMLRYAWPLVMVGIAGVINQSSYITFQKYLLPNGLTENLSDGGVFAAAASLAILLNLFTVAFNYAAEPFFFAHKDREDARQVYADVALAFTIVGATMMLGILAYMDLVQLLLGKNFREGLFVVPILLLSFLVLGIYYNFSTWYKLADKTIYGAWIAGLGAVMTIILNIVLIPRYQIIGSAWAALICYLFMCIASYVQGQKYFPIPYRITKMILWILVAIGFFFVMNFLRQFYEDQIAIILLVNTLLIGVYVLIVFLVEKSLLKQVMRRS